MKFLGLTVLATVLYMAYNDSPGSLVSMQAWHFLLNNTGISGMMNETDIKTNELIKQLTDKKQDLAFLRQQIADLTQGLKDMPDKNQTGYFRDLITRLQDKERMLNQQIAQQEQLNQERKRSLFAQEDFPSGKKDMNAMMSGQQVRVEDQMQKMNDMIQQNQILMEAQSDKESDLKQSQIYLQSSAQRD